MVSFSQANKQMKYLVVLLFVIGTTAGCGGSTGIEVSGTVSFTDGGPLPRGVVNIDGPGGSYRAAIAADGSYTISGVADGSYKVAITGAMDGDSVQSDEMEYDADGNYVEPEVEEPKSLIGPDYSDPSKSGLELTVPGEYDLKVSKAE